MWLSFPSLSFHHQSLYRLVDWFLACLTDKYCKNTIMTKYYDLCDHLDHYCFSRDHTFHLHMSLCLPMWSFIMMVSCHWFTLVFFFSVCCLCVVPFCFVSSFTYMYMQLHFETVPAIQINVKSNKCTKFVFAIDFQ